MKHRSQLAFFPGSLSSPHPSFSLSFPIFISPPPFLLESFYLRYFLKSNLKTRFINKSECHFNNKFPLRLGVWGGYWYPGGPYEGQNEKFEKNKKTGSFSRFKLPLRNYSLGDTIRQVKHHCFCTICILHKEVRLLTPCFHMRKLSFQKANNMHGHSLSNSDLEQRP